MNRKQLTRACYAVLLAGALLMLLGARAPGGSSPDAAIHHSQVQEFTIDISDLAMHLRDKPQKEVEDQVRDWAVYGTLVQMGVDQDTMAKATFKTAPVRLRYLEDAFLFDYGRGRRALVGNDVLLFYDHDDPDPTATLGRLADKVRMETGEIPGTFQVFTIIPDLPSTEIRVVRRESVTGDAMFGQEYGYVERKVQGLDDFTAWLDQIDDVTFAGLKDDALHLGGRRFPKSRTKGVTVEDVAALLQAHVDLENRRARRKAAEDRINAEYNAELRSNRRPLYDPSFGSTSKLLDALKRNGGLDTDADLDQLLRQLGAQPLGASPDNTPGAPKVSEEQIRAKYVEQFKALEHVPETPGFSLDPQWMPHVLAPKLDRLAIDPCGVGQDALQNERGPQPEDAKSLALSDAEDVKDLESKDACAAIAMEHGPTFLSLAQKVRDADKNLQAVDEAMIEFEQLRSSSSLGPLLRAIVGSVRSTSKVQCARYDGPLQGTHVGMNLFYTDLVAKLWQSVDYHHSAPTAAVAGFLSKPRMNMEVQWREEAERLPSTRIWFGPKAESYTRGSDESAILLEHIAARVYAAGSNSASREREEQPAEASRRALGFWDRHFGDVAGYEQQYHVQNQIMKWSLITGSQHAAFSFLRSVAVRHEQVFDQWYENEKSKLRYEHGITLRPRSDWVTGTECMDLLGSYGFPSYGIYYQISGGVRLGGRRMIDAAPKIELRKPVSLRHILAESGHGPGTATRVYPNYSGPGKVVSELGPTTRARTRVADLALEKIDIAFVKDAANDTRIALKTNKGDIGTVIGQSVDRGRVTLRWRPSTIEASVRGGDRVATRGALEGDHLGTLQRGTSRAPIRFEDRPEMILSERGSDEALRVATGDVGKPGENGLLSVRNTSLSGIRQSEIASLLDQYPWQKLSVQGDDAKLDVAQAVLRTFQKSGPQEATFHVKLTGIDGFPNGVEARVTARGEVFLPRPTSSDEIAGWRNIDVRGALTGKDITRLAEKGSGGATTIGRESLSSPAIERAHEALAEGNSRKAIDQLLSTGRDAPQMRDALGDLAAKALDDARFQFDADNPAEAGRLYRRVAKMFGDVPPDERMRAAVANIEGGNPKKGIDLLGDPSKLSHAELDDLMDATARRGGDLHGFFAARRRGSPVLFGGRAEALELLPEGVETRSALRIDRIQGRLLDTVERRMLIEHPLEPVEVYLHDGSYSINQHDFEISGRGTVAELAKSPTVAWEHVVSAGESYAPGIVVEADGTRYRHVGTVGANRATLRFLSPPRVRHAVLIRNCDSDGDGVVSDAEKLACGL